MESKDGTEAEPRENSSPSDEDIPSNVTEDVIHGFHFPHAQVKLPQQKTP